MVVKNIAGYLYGVNMTKEVMKQAIEVLKSKDTCGSSIREAKEDVIKALEKALKQEQSKPLTSEQIDEIYFDSTLDIDRQYNQLYAFARAIEAAHGIKDNNS